MNCAYALVPDGCSRSRQSNFKITLLYFLHFTIIFRMGVSRTPTVLVLTIS